MHELLFRIMAYKTTYKTTKNKKNLLYTHTLLNPIKLRLLFTTFTSEWPCYTINTCSASLIKKRYCFWTYSSLRCTSWFCPSLETASIVNIAFHCIQAFVCQQETDKNLKWSRRHFYGRTEGGNHFPACQWFDREKSKSGTRKKRQINDEEEDKETERLHDTQPTEKITRPDGLPLGWGQGGRIVRDVLDAITSRSEWMHTVEKRCVERLLYWSICLQSGCCQQWGPAVGELMHCRVEESVAHVWSSVQLSYLKHHCNNKKK